MQAERKARRAVELEEARLLYQLAELQDLAWEPKDDGFVFSREEIKVHTERYHRLNLAKKGDGPYRKKNNLVEITRSAPRAA